MDFTNCESINISLDHEPPGPNRALLSQLSCDTMRLAENEREPRACMFRRGQCGHGTNSFTT